MEQINNDNQAISRRRNYLTKVLRVQEIYTHHDDNGLKSGYIFKHYISKQFDIGRSTFYNYLTIPAKKELKELDNLIQNNQQP